MKAPQVLDYFADKPQPGGDILMSLINDLKLGKYIREYKLKCFNRPVTGTHLNTLFDSPDKENLLILLNDLWVELFDLLQFAVE